MKFTTVAIVLATAAIAHGVLPLDWRPKSHTSPNPLSRVSSDQHHVEHYRRSRNWAGVVKHSRNIQYVTGEIVVPEARVPRDGDFDSTYKAVAWVGIDGQSCLKSLLQTGIEVQTKGGNSIASAWFEWIPEFSHDFDLHVRIGDRVRMTVDATGLNSGWAAIENLTTGKSGNHTFVNKRNDLCQTDADWIVERFDQVVDGVRSPVPYADTGTIHFTNCEAANTDGQRLGLDGSDVIYLANEDREIVTKCAIDDDTSLTCEYTGSSGPGDEESRAM